MVDLSQYLPILIFLVIALGLSAAFVFLPMGVARLTAQSMRRDRARAEPLPPDDPALDVAAPPPPEPIDRGHLARCLGKLPERERSVIVLTFFDDAKSAEVGATLGIDPGHVRVVRHRALARLRACLAPEEGSPA